MFEHAKMPAGLCGLRLPEILGMLTKFLPSLEPRFIRIVRECSNARLFHTGRP